jgi:hypothetical protein
VLTSSLYQKIIDLKSNFSEFTKKYIIEDIIHFCIESIVYYTGDQCCGDGSVCLLQDGRPINNEEKY